MTAALAPPGQVELFPKAPAAPCTSYRVVTFDPASGCEIAPRGFPKFSEAIRDLPFAAARAASAAEFHGEPVWLLGADNTSCEISPDGDVTPDLGWAALVARVLNNRKDPTLMPAKPKTPDGPVLTDIPLDKIVQHPHNIRVDLGDLTDLAKSINAEGYLVPGLVLPANDEGLYYLIDGHRRHGAGQLLDPPPAMPCLIRDLTEAQVIETMLTTGIQRQDISAVEEARGYARLVELDTSYGDIAEKMGRTQKHIKGRIKLLQLPPQVVDAIHAGALSLAQGDAVLEHVTDAEAMDWVVGVVSGGVNHSWNASNALRNHIDSRDRKAGLDALRAQLRDEGVTEYKAGPYWNAPASVGDCRRPVKVETLALTAAQTRKHTAEPCHAAVVDEAWYSSTETGKASGYQARRTDVCTNPRRHTTLDLTKGDGERSKLQMKPATYASAANEGAPDPDGDARRAAEEARAAATGDRRRFVQTLLIEGTPPAIDPVTAAALFSRESEFVDEFTDDFLLAPGDDESSDTWQIDRWHRWAADPNEVARAAWVITVYSAEQAIGSAPYAWSDVRRAQIDDAAVVAYLDHLAGAGYKISEIEQADLDTVRQRITDRDQAAKAAAAAAEQRATDEANPTMAIAEARFAELSPDCLIAFAELAAWDPDQAPMPMLEEGHVEEMTAAGVAAFDTTEEGGELFVTDFGRKAIELVDEGTTTGFAGLVDEAAAAAGEAA